MKAQTNAKNDLTSHLCSGEEGVGGDRRGEEGRGGGNAPHTFRRYLPQSRDKGRHATAHMISPQISAHSAQRIMHHSAITPCAPGSFRAPWSVGSVAQNTEQSARNTIIESNLKPHRTLRPYSFSFSAQPACLGNALCLPFGPFHFSR